MSPLSRPTLERAKREDVQRLAKWLRIEHRGAVAERVARHLAEQDMRGAWPPRLTERRW